jgi:hypothetical protein
MLAPPLYSNTESQGFDKPLIFTIQECPLEQNRIHAGRMRVVGAES